jgi:class 3 adenylate cyclase
LGEERADELRQVHDRLLGERIEAHSGRVVKGLGDGLMAVGLAGLAARINTSCDLPGIGEGRPQR